MRSQDVFLSQIFLSLETFLKKTTTLNIFETLLFNYKIKVGSVEDCSPQFISFVVDLCNDLQLILKENIARENEKSEREEKSETTLCELQTVDPNFAELPIPSTSELECGDRGHWEQNGSQDAEANNSPEIAAPGTSLSSFPHKNREIFTCQYCNRKYRTNKKFCKHVCKSAPVLSEPQDEEYIDDPEAEHISQIDGWNQMRSDDDSSPTSIGGVEALLTAAKFIEEQHEEKEEYEFIRLNEILNGKDEPLSQENSDFPSTHDHTYTLTKQVIPDIKNGRNKKDKKIKARLRECYETLRNQLPLDVREEKTYSIVIHNAVWNIASLQREGKQFEQEVENLTVKNLAYKHTLSVLKDDLIAHSENVDLNNVLQAMLELKSGRVCDLVSSQKVETRFDKNTVYNSLSSSSGNHPLQPDSDTVQAQILESLSSSRHLKTNSVQTRLPSNTVSELPADTPFVGSHISDNSRVEDNRDSNYNILTHSKHSTADVNTFRLPLKVVQLRDPFLLPTPFHSPDLHNFTHELLQQPHLVKPAASPSKVTNNSACDSDGSDSLPLFFCTVCLSAYSQRESFDQHSHSDNAQEVDLLTDLKSLQDQRKFVCGVCSEVYRSLARIVYHVGRCRAGPYHCELCNDVAASRHLLNQHKKKHHKGVECFFCAECGLGFKLRTSLQKHQVNRHESEQNNFPCDADDCGLLFHKKIQLTNHKIEVHGVEGKFLCQVCGHKFMNQDSLSSHLECHGDKKKFRCEFCEKLFKSKEKMTLHVRTHTGERPFVCNRPNCCKSFVSKSKLVEHLQRHNGEKRHMCCLCGKKYANKHDLRAHTRKVHSAGDPIQTSKTVAIDSVLSSEDPCFESSSEVMNMSLYSPQVILQVDNPSSHVYNNVQFYPELVRTVTVPQNVLLTSYEAVIGT